MVSCSMKMTRNANNFTASHQPNKHFSMTTTSTYYISSSESESISLSALAHVPLHSEQADEQVIPCFRHEQRWVVQPDLQPQRITSKNF